MRLQDTLYMRLMSGNGVDKRRRHNAITLAMKARNGVNMKYNTYVFIRTQDRCTMNV